MTTDFREIRTALINKGLVPSSCREQGPYKYTRNGATVRRREAGEVFSALLKLTGQRCSPPIASWSGRWPRTEQSWEAETDGTDLFWGLVLRAGDMGLLQWLSQPS